MAEKYFYEIAFDNKVHMFLSTFKLWNNKIKYYTLQSDDVLIQELDTNILIFNSMPQPHNTARIYELLSKVCVDDTARKHFSQMALDLNNQEYAIPQKNTTFRWKIK